MFVRGAASGQGIGDDQGVAGYYPYSRRVGGGGDYPVADPLSNGWPGPQGVTGVGWCRSRKRRWCTRLVGIGAGWGVWQRGM